MSLSARSIAPFLMSATFATATMAQSLFPDSTISNKLEVSATQPSDAPSGTGTGSGDEQYDYRDYCEQPLKLTTQTASEFFNLVGCEGGDNAEFWINTPLVDSGFKIPTPDDYTKGDELAKCLYGSLPGGTVITDEAYGMVGTGDFMMGEDVLRDLERGIVYECLSLNAV